MKEEDQKYVREYINNQSSSSARRLVEKYQTAVFSLCMRILKDRQLAEETAQDSFIKCFSELDKLENLESFKPWLMKITFHTAIDRGRIVRRNSVPLDSAISIPSNALLHPEKYVVQMERREALEALIGELPESDRAIIQLYYMEDLPIREIAETLNLTSANVKIKLMRARTSLHSRLKQIYKDELSNFYRYGTPQ